MDLPLDYRNRPFKPKYLDTETLVTNSWFIFGRYEDGTVCVTDGTTDIIDRIPLDAAKEIVNARETFLRVLYAKMCEERD